MVAYDLGIRLRDLRKKHKLTQKQVAGKLELTESAVSSYERNMATPPGDVVKKLAILFRVSADYILGLESRKHVSVDGLSDKQLEVIEVLVSELKDKK